MKRTFISILLLVTAATLCGGDFRVILDFSYSQGFSSFFNLSERRIETENPGLESVRNRLGMGFKLGVQVPVYKDLAIVPSLGVGFGFQKCSFLPDDTEAAKTGKNYYFRNWAPALDAAYTLLRLKNDWQFQAQTGFSYNILSGNKPELFEKSGYLGWQAGLGATFRQVKDWGFHSLFYFKTLFTSEKISYLGVDIGLFYRL